MPPDEPKYFKKIKLKKCFKKIRFKKEKLREFKIGVIINVMTDFSVLITIFLLLD
jgi:hypothetical protein